MSYSAKIEGFEGQNIEVKVSFWSGPKLLINGEPASKGPKRGEMVLQRNDGKQVTAIWKPQFLGLDVPQVEVDGKVVSLVEPLKWYQWIWGGWPIMLLFLGGALGAVAGMISITINARIFRTGMSSLLKYIASGAVSIFTVVAYFVAAMIIALLIHSK
jgi:hypothetical protein